jgi:ELWxxDGT repeat protein
LINADGTLFFVAQPAVGATAGDYLFRYTPPPFTPAAPAAPSGFAGTPDNATQITLSWADLARNEESYLLERSRDANFASIESAVSLKPNTNFYVDKGLFGGTTYYYRLRAINSAGESTPATVGPLTTQMGPAAPGNFRAVEAVPGERVDLSWTDNAQGETGYVVQRSSNPDFFPAGAISLNVTLPTGSTSYSDPTVTRLTKYYYRVFAVGPSGNSGAALTSVTTAESKPVAPSGLLAVGVSASQIDLQWSDNSPNESADDGFRVERAQGNGDFVQIASLAANAVTYTDRNLQPGRFYTYRVRAANTVGPSAYATSERVRTLPPSLTTKVKQLPALPGSDAANPPHPDFLTPVGEDLYFVSSPLATSTNAENAGGRELWKTDGTNGGTVRLYTGGMVRDLMNVGGTLYFIDRSSIWKTDGTAAGTTKVLDVLQLPSPRERVRLVAALGGRVFFGTWSSPNGANAYQLWQTNGTPGNFAPVADSVWLPFRSDQKQETAISGKWMYFLDGFNFGANHGGSLWRTDGVTTQKIAGLADVAHLAEVDGTVYAVGRPTGRNAHSLFKVDSDSDVPVAAVVRDLADYSGAGVESLTRVGDELHFVAATDQQGWVLWKSDGTAAGTAPYFDPIQDNYPFFRGRPYMILDAGGGGAYFLTADEDHGGPQPTGWLWKTDGTAAGTVRVRAFTPPYVMPYGPRPLFMTVVDGKLIYSDADHLWRSDGTIHGTHQIDLIGTSPDGARSPAVFAGSAWAVIGDKVFFSGAVNGGGRDLRIAYLDKPNAPDTVNVSEEPAPAGSPGAPAPASPAGIRLTWADRSDSESGFMIERSATADFAVIDATFFAPADATGYLDSSAAPGARYFYRVRAVNAGGESSDSNSTASGPPVVLGADFRYATPQHALEVRFSADVAAGLLAGGAFAVTNLATGQSIPAQIVFDETTNSAEITFGGGRLGDGRYHLVLESDVVRGKSGQALDGNGDGTAGGDYSFEFFHLGGDVNRDATVNFADLVALAQNYGTTGKTWGQGDFNADGSVNFADLVILAQNYNRSLASASPPAASSHAKQAPATFAEALKLVGLGGATQPSPRPTPPLRPKPRPVVAAVPPAAKALDRKPSGHSRATTSRTAFSTLPIRPAAPTQKSKRAPGSLLA